MRLKATSLLETIVASVIFLIVFGMAMHAAVDLRKLGAPDWAQIERDFNEFRRQVPKDREVFEYEWGKIETQCRDYHDVPGLVDVQATLCLKDGRKTVYRYLCCEDEMTNK